VTKRRTKKDTAAAQVMCILTAIAGFIYAVSRHDILLALWTGSFVVALACWLIAVQMPTTCNVITKRGHPCPNNTYGVLFGCGQAQGHTWTKFFARFGIHRKTVHVRPIISGSAPIQTVAASSTATVSGVDDKTKDLIVFWLTVISTAAGVVSMATSIIAIA
jgi:hypothetical protein